MKDNFDDVEKMNISVMTPTRITALKTARILGKSESEIVDIPFFETINLLIKHIEEKQKPLIIKTPETDIKKCKEEWKKIPVTDIPNYRGGFTWLNERFAGKMINNAPMVEILRNKSINDYCKEAFETATSKGWHDEEREIGTMLALIHSEVSEALEACRKSNEDNFIEELADVCIRVFDLCGKMQIDLEGAIEAKMLKNKKRSYKHGGKAF